MITKEYGNSLAIEWVADEKTAVYNAIDRAKTNLETRGFGKRKLRDMHVQALTSLNHGYMVIIKARYKTPYKTYMGNMRTSYGCGFSNKSPADAELAAVNNLKTYSWGWKREFGYELYARHEF